MGKKASARDVVRFLRMSIGSCDETQVWLKYARDLGYLSPEECSQLQDGYGEVGRMLTGLIKRWTSGPSDQP